MKVLFYSELHPIRNEPDHHKSVVCRWVNILKKIDLANLNKRIDGRIEGRILCNQLNYEHATASVKRASEYLIAPNTLEQCRIDKNFKTWGGESIEEWINMLNGSGKENHLVYREILERIKIFFDYDVVVFWGDNRFLSDWLESQGVQSFFMELSTIRNPFSSTIYLDPCGVNGNALASCLTVEQYETLSRFAVEPEVIEELSLANPFHAKNAFDSAFSYYDQSLDFNNEKNLAKKRILVPLQIADDTNILSSSDYRSAFDFLNDIFAKYENFDVEFVVKPHPGAEFRSGVVFNDHLHCRELTDSVDNASWLESEIGKDRYTRFLKTFDGVITINSSVGFEAMLLGIPTQVNGGAIYKPVGSIFADEQLHCYTDAQLERVVKLGRLITMTLMSAVFFSVEDSHFSKIFSDTLLLGMEWKRDRDTFKYFRELLLMRIKLMSEWELQC